MFSTLNFHLTLGRVKATFVFGYTQIPLRVHIVQEFNKGVYDYIIATDESSGTIEVDSDIESDGEEQDGEHEKEDMCK